MTGWLDWSTVYITRPMPEGRVDYYKLPLWMIVAAIHLACLNVIVWGVIGLVTAAKVIL